MSRKMYEILIRHQEGVCPALPAGVAYRPGTDYWQCPVHLVFARVCELGIARHRIDLLKEVKGVVQIRLCYGGEDRQHDWWAYNEFQKRWEHAN